MDLLLEVFASIVSPQDWFRVLKIVSAPSSGVLNNHKGEILPFCSETKIEISVCVPSLTRAHNPPICKPSNFGEEQQQQVRNSNLHKKIPYFSKTLAVDKSFWTATHTSPTAWVKTDPTRPTDLGGTCFYVSAETLSLESPFPRLRNLLPKRVHPLSPTVQLAVRFPENIRS